MKYQCTAQLEYESAGRQKPNEHKSTGTHSEVCEVNGIRWHKHTTPKRRQMVTQTDGADGDGLVQHFTPLD